MPSTPSPTARTRPTPSTPRILGLGTSVQAAPCRTPISMKLTPAKAISTNASPGPGTGSGRSTYSSISRPPVPFITMAFIHQCGQALIRLKALPGRGRLRREGVFERPLDRGEAFRSRRVQCKDLMKLGEERKTGSLPRDDDGHQKRPACPL